MDHHPRVQVVLGEAERTDGLLRFVLEAEGFDLVGLASNDEELARVLRGARPAVVVLDGGISATAALDARERCQGAALVVVWPDGVSAVLADERVEPHMAIEDLGDAVRRAVHRAETRDEAIHVPEAVDPTPPVPVNALATTAWFPPPSRRKLGARRGHVLIAAATWFLVITAFTAIAAAVPNALELFTEHGRGRPSLSPPPPVDRPVDQGEGRSEPSVEDPAPACDPSATRGDGADRSAGRGDGDPMRAQGCPPDRVNDANGDKANTGNKGGNKDGNKGGNGGRPDDPGSQGNAGGSGGSSGVEGDDAGDASGGADGGTDQGNGGAGEEHGKGGAGGKQEEHHPAGQAGRSGESG